jgi:hypothetical protein
VGTTTVGVELTRLQADKSHTNATKIVNMTLRDMRNPFFINQDGADNESPVIQ